MPPTRSIAAFALALAIPTLTGPPPAHALPDKEEAHLEGSLGYYAADSVLDFADPLTYGARGGWRWRRFGVEATVSRFKSDFDLDTTTGNYELLAFDLSANLYLNPRSRWEWSLFAGPGWRYTDTVNVFGARTEHPIESSITDNRLTFHVGVAVRITAGERIYVRPDFRVRTDAAGDFGGDVEASVALGYSFF